MNLATFTAAFLLTVAALCAGFALVALLVDRDPEPPPPYSRHK